MSTSIVIIFTLHKATVNINVGLTVVKHSKVFENLRGMLLMSCQRLSHALKSNPAGSIIMATLSNRSSNRQELKGQVRASRLVCTRVFIMHLIIVYAKQKQVHADVATGKSLPI